MCIFTWFNTSTTLTAFWKCMHVTNPIHMISISIMPKQLKYPSPGTCLSFIYMQLLCHCSSVQPSIFVPVKILMLEGGNISYASFHTFCSICKQPSHLTFTCRTYSHKELYKSIFHQNTGLLTKITRAPQHSSK